MKSNRLVNGLALVGALIVIFGVGSAANEAFAASPEAGLIFAAETIAK
jgi:hypothetical protein